MWIAIAAVLVLVVVVVLLRRRGRNASPVSIVMLRSKPRGFTEADVRGAYRRALKAEPQVQTIPRPDGLTNGLLLISERLPPLAVIDSSRTYMEADEVADHARRFEHPTARDALLAHKAWVSIDAMGSIGMKRAMRAKIYPLLARVAAELYDHDSLLLYLPAESRFASPGPDVEKMLRDGRIDELFGDDSLHAPIFHTEPDDTEINRAMDEARSRLPELLGAFDHRGEQALAMIKSRFGTGDGGSEFVWIKLQRIDDHQLVGTIENSPLDPEIPKKGSTVGVNPDSVVDWAYIDENKKPIGLFVDRILARRQA